MEQVVLCNRGDEKETIEDLKSFFIRDILEQTGIPLEEVWKDNIINFSIEEKIKLRSFLKTYDILIIDDSDGGIKIYLDKEIIAEWKKCRFELFIDQYEVDPKKQICVKIFTNYWSAFDQ